MNMVIRRPAIPEERDGQETRPLEALEKTHLRMGTSDVYPTYGAVDTGRGTSTLVVLGRSRRMAVEDHHKELKKLVETHGSVGGEVRKTIGDVASALVIAGCNVEN